MDLKLKIEEIQRTGEESALELFYQGIRADATREAYERRLKYILSDVLSDILVGTFEERASQFVRLAKEKPDWTRDLLLCLSRKLRERTELPKNDPDYLSPGTFGNYFKPIKKILDMNDVAIPWKRIYATFPEREAFLNFTRGWTKPEIQKMLQFTYLPSTRALVLVLASSGIRLGGLDLNWQDVRPVFDVDGQLKLEVEEQEFGKSRIACAILTIYRGSQWEYPAFITPEAYGELMECKREWIREVGREPRLEESVFKKRGRTSERLGIQASRSRIEDLIKRAQIRPEANGHTRRYEVPTINGFRRFWNKTCKEAIPRDSPLSSLIKKEFMMGHTGLVKLDRNYFKTNLLELAEEYVTVVPQLTIMEQHDFL